MGLANVTSADHANRKVRKMPTSGVTLSELMPSWERSLEARNLAPLSVTDYRKRLNRFIRWLWAQDDGLRHDTLAEVTRADCEKYLADSLKAGAAAKSVQDYHGTLKVFFQWLVDEGEIGRSPMAQVRAPIVPESPPALLTDEQLAALLRTCEGLGTEHTSFMARRDAAILRVLIDTGLRLSEIAGMTTASVDLIRAELTVLAKGRKRLIVAMHGKTVAALDRYQRIRQRHADAPKLDLWLGAKGPLTDDGIYQIVKRRALQAGIPARVWPHLLRHGQKHQWLKEGGSEGGLMRQSGWKDRRMLDRYGSALADDRARDEAKKMQGGDRL